MHTRIFVPFNSTRQSKKAFDVALKIANKNKASIAVVMFLKEETLGEQMGFASEHIYKFYEDLRDDFFFDRDVAKLYKKCHDAKVPLWHDIVYAEAPEKGIAIFARRNKIDLIVMGSRGRKGWTKKILGSVSDKVKKLKIPCKLMIVEN